MTLVLPLRSTNSFLPLPGIDPFAEEAKAGEFRPLLASSRVERETAERDGTLGEGLAAALLAGVVVSSGDLRAEPDLAESAPGEDSEWPAAC